MTEKICFNSTVKYNLCTDQKRLNYTHVNIASFIKSVRVLAFFVFFFPMKDDLTMAADNDSELQVYWLPFTVFPPLRGKLSDTFLSLLLSPNPIRVPVNNYSTQSLILNVCVRHKSQSDISLALDFLAHSPNFCIFQSLFMKPWNSPNYIQHMNLRKECLEKDARYKIVRHVWVIPLTRGTE